ncbi:hypothetical protein [Nocardioides caricicola]|uniref:Uncharacterized protein n=1 Tax=Nocardioides caricicola TaxID=634770 RepID=A0ABW0MZH2_9ACTN
MRVWQEWRGPRQSWSRTTKVASWVAALVLVLAWVTLIDHLR